MPKMTRLREINVVLIDDNVDNLRHLKEYITPVTSVTCGDGMISCELHAFGPITSGNRTKVDLDKTLKKIVELRPGVTVIDLKLEGDAENDYSGAELAFRIKKCCKECCIILVSHYFDADPGLLDNIEIFRFRVDRNQPDYGKYLKERFSDAVRHYVSAINLRKFLKEQAAFKQHQYKLPSRAVYISYARDNKCNNSLGHEEIVNRIEEALRTNGYDVRRDATSIQYTASISSFMKEIGRGRCIIAVVSDKYLRSPYCMYELLEVYRNNKFHERICPVVLTDALVTSINGRLSYVDYWSNQMKEIKTLLKKIDYMCMAPETIEECNRYRDISQNAAKLLSFIADMQHLTPEELEKNDFDILRERIDKCLKITMRPG